MSDDSIVLDRQALYLALDDLRLARGLSWRRVAEDSGVKSSATFTKLAKGEGPSSDNLLLLLAWLDADWREFRIDDRGSAVDEVPELTERLDGTRV